MPVPVFNPVVTVNEAFDVACDNVADGRPDLASIALQLALPEDEANLVLESIQTFDAKRVAA